MPDVGGFLDQVGDYALTWLPLIFFGLIIYLLWRTLQMMPRVKPTHVQPHSRSSVSWGSGTRMMEPWVAGLRPSPESRMAFSTADASPLSNGWTVRSRGSGAATSATWLSGTAEP